MAADPPVRAPVWGAPTAGEPPFGADVACLRLLAQSGSNRRPLGGFGLQSEVMMVYKWCYRQAHLLEPDYFESLGHVHDFTERT